MSDREFASLNIKRDPFHSKWNYTVQPPSAAGSAILTEPVIQV